MESLIYYSGIGSRRSPTKTLERMKQIGFDLAMSGFVLRSGASNGADTAFEHGCDAAEGKKEIFLPWKNFNKNASLLSAPPIDAIKIAEKHLDPNYWKSITSGVKLLYSRNVQIILGKTLDHPSDFVVCWTSGSFGTNHSLSVAREYNIPIFNLINPADIQEMNLFVTKLLERAKND